MAIITIEVDEEIKTAFEGATPETQQQLSTIIQLFFRKELQNKTLDDSNKNEPDSLIGLFKDSPDLATKSEEILHQEIREKSGWTWKEN